MHIKFPETDILKKAALARDLDVPLKIEACHRPLADFLKYYGFDKIMAMPEVQYSLGGLGYKGTRILGHRWVVPAQKGDILLVHGLFDHTGIFLKLVENLLLAGFNVFALDMPGHGLSEGPTTGIREFSEYGDILDICLGKMIEYSGSGEIYGVAQSTGCAGIIKLMSQGRHKEKIKKAVLLAPLVRPRSWWSVNLRYVLLSRFIHKIPRKFAVNSTDEEFLDFLANKDPLQPQYISIEWLGAMRRWIKTFSKTPNNPTPILIIQGDQDLTVDWKYNLPNIQKYFSHSKVLMLPGAKHHLANESEVYRKKISEAIKNFLILGD